MLAPGGHPVFSGFKRAFDSEHTCDRGPLAAVGVVAGGDSASFPPVMTRRSLRPHLNQIRSWVRQGRTDAWIAHQLEVTVQQIQAFKREQELEPDGEAAPATEEVDLRGADDEAIA